MNNAAKQPPLASRAGLDARGVCRSYKMGESAVTVLKGVDFSLRPGEFVAIEGRSGSGKSTLLHVLAGLESIDSGMTTFESFDYTTYMQEAPRYGHMLRPGDVYHWFRAVMVFTWRW